MATDETHYIDNPKIITVSDPTIFENKKWIDRVKEILVKNNYSSFKLLNF